MGTRRRPLKIELVARKDPFKSEIRPKSEKELDWFHDGCITFLLFKQNSKQRKCNNQFKKLLIHSCLNNISVKGEIYYIKKRSRWNFMISNTSGYKSIFHALRFAKGDKADKIHSYSQDSHFWLKSFEYLSFKFEFDEFHIQCGRSILLLR